MQRRVLILTLAYPPSAAIGAFRAARFAKYLPDFAWQPIVATCEDDAMVTDRDDSRMQWVDADTIVDRTCPWRLPKFLSRRWRTSFGSTGQSQTRSPAASNSVPTTSTPTTRARFSSRMNALKSAVLLPFRIPDKHIWWAVPALRSMRRLVREYNPDVLFVTSPPHSVHLIALALRAWKQIPIVMDFRDPWARTEWSAAHEGRIRTAADRFLEKFCVARADRVILNTPELLAHFQQAYPPKWREKFSAIPNGYDPQVRAQIESLVAAVPAKAAGSRLRICHAGSVYGRRDIRPIIEAVALLNRQGFAVEFEQVGTLVNPAEVAACIDHHRAHDFVKVLGQQSHEEALRRMAAADILVIVRQNTALQTPAKLYELMLFGKPILALDEAGAMTRIVREFGLGIVANPVDPVAIAQAIEVAAKTSADASSTGRQAALRQYDARVQTGELAKVLEAAVVSRQRKSR